MGSEMCIRDSPKSSNDRIAVVLPAPAGPETSINRIFFFSLNSANLTTYLIQDNALLTKTYIREANSSISLPKTVGTL